MKKRSIMLLTVLLLAAALAGCGETAESEEEIIEEVRMIVEANSIRRLEAYPDLKIADLTGSTCYQAIEEYIAKNPNQRIIYTVDLGGSAAEPDVRELVLPKGTYDFDTMMQNLQFLHNLTSVELPDTDMPEEEFQALREAYPNITIEYSTEILGKKYTSRDTQLDFSALEPSQVAAVAAKLPILRNVTDVELMRADGTSGLEMEDVAQLQKALPHAVFHYTFQLFGKTVSTADEEVVFVNQYLSDEHEGELRQALDIMRGCKRFVLDNCHFSNEVLAKVRDDYRDTTKVVWRIWFAKAGSCLTDRTVIRYVYNLFDSNCHDLVYCEDAEYIDFGHNEFLTDCSWVKHMTKLKAIILSGSMIADISDFANCESLEFLELAYCGYLKDLSPLEACKNLQMVNVSFTPVEDMSPLMEQELTHLAIIHTGISEEQREEYAQKHPDCWILYEGVDHPYGVGWRYEADGHSTTAYYERLKEAFGYPDATDTNW